jgi:hypothetical protein
MGAMKLYLCVVESQMQDQQQLVQCMERNVGEFRGKPGKTIRRLLGKTIRDERRLFPVLLVVD